MVPRRGRPKLAAHTLDEAIPFVPAASWCYLHHLRGIFISRLPFRTRTHFDRALRGVLLIMLVGVMGHLLGAAEYPRPVLKSHHTLIFPRRCHGRVWSGRSIRRGTVFLRCTSRTRRPGVDPSSRESRGWARVTIVWRRCWRYPPLHEQHFIADVHRGLALAAFNRVVLLRGLPPWPRRGGPPTAAFRRHDARACAGGSDSSFQFWF